MTWKRKRYLQPTLVVARRLLGATLVRTVQGSPSTSAGTVLYPPSLGTKIIRGIIFETEAYDGQRDLANHASRGRTPRTEVMFGPAGHAYIYLVYGMHHCLNVVTGPVGYPAAVLIRSVMLYRELGIRNYELGAEVSGPGRVCKTFAIDRALNGWDLTRGKKLWIEDTPREVLRNYLPMLKLRQAGEIATKTTKLKIVRSPRIGVDYAGQWAKKKWRFVLQPRNLKS
jgi:DNA-3-methyladenine glycosylase